MDWATLIAKLNNDLELFLEHLPKHYPAGLSTSTRTPDELLRGLEALDKSHSDDVDEACRDYARNGRFQKRLSHEELFLLQFRFYGAVVLCCLLGQPPRPEEGQQELFDPPCDQSALLEWLLISAWDVQGRKNWILQEEAVARRIAPKTPPQGA